MSPAYLNARCKVAFDSEFLHIHLEKLQLKSYDLDNRHLLRRKRRKLQAGFCCDNKQEADASL